MSGLLTTQAAVSRSFTTLPFCVRRMALTISSSTGSTGRPCSLSQNAERKLYRFRANSADASALFARNLYNFLSAFWDKEQGRPVLPDDDEIVKAVRLTRSGKVVNERLTAA